MTEPRTPPEYFMGWDGETVYIRRAECSTMEAATEAFRRISLDDLGLDEDDIDGIVGEAQTVPLHESEESRCYRGECQCPSVDVWAFAP